LVTGEDAMIVSKDRDEMHLLLMGEGDYYLRGRDDMGDPQDHIALWDKVLIPYTVMPFNGRKLGKGLRRAVEQLLTYREDRAKALYSADSGGVRRRSRFA
jgi:hypothetical protein